MNFILCQPAINRFKWELEVCLTNLKSYGIDNIILLFTQHDDSIPNYFENKYHANCFVYPDNRLDKYYIPSVKPYLWWQFLKHNPSAEKGTYFYQDADVIFNQLPDFKKIDFNKKLWVGSDCSSYLSPDYIVKKDKDYIKLMANIIGINEDQANSFNTCSAGAQWIITDPTAAYWKKVYQDCSKLYEMFNSVENKYRMKHGNGYVPIQKWTAEMWSQLWNMKLFDIQPEIAHKLDFCFATDDIKKLKKVDIIHNAGVTVNNKDLFFKGKYVNTDPFHDDLSFVNKDKVSYAYVQAIKKVN